MKAPNNELIEGPLSKSIIGAFYTVFNALGPGFSEHVYSAAFEYEIAKRGHRVGREVAVPVYYDGAIVAYQRLDMLVEGRVIIENKAHARDPRADERQAYNYLRCTRLELALLFYFTTEPKFRRVVHSPR